MKKQTDQHKTLTARLNAEREEANKRAQQETDSRAQLAQLWDAAVERNPLIENLPQPWFIHASKLHGAIGSYSFKDATPEDCAGLLAAFAPVPTAIVKTQMWTSWRPAGYVDPKLGGGEKVISSTPVEGGASMELDRYQGSGSKVKVSWYTMLHDGANDCLVRFDVELATIHGVTPHMAAHIEYADPAHNHISRVSNAGPEFAIKPALPMAHIRYSAGTASSFPRITIYNNVPAYVEQMAGWCYSSRMASKKAYQEDKIAGLAPVQESRPYDEQGKLRAGTREQFDCLNSEPARRDRALAEKHWKAYAADYDIESSQGYFDHYAWACAYLKRNGLYEVPDPRDPSKSYKYGHAWL